MQTEIESGTGVFASRHVKSSFYVNHAKRPLDFILSLCAILLLLPVLLIIAALVRIKLGTPVIFRQERPGLNGNIFTLYKFRTMTDKRTENGELLPDSMRITKLGRILRSLSLDELPELYNILKGEMSFIGPRPLAVEYLPYYNKEESRRHDVKPGLSGLAQINGRNSTTWELRFNYDIIYVDNITFLGDLKIFLKTILKVIQRSGIGEYDPLPDFNKYRQQKIKNM